MSHIQMKIPQVMKYKLYLISMMINGSEQGRSFMDELFLNSCDYDFGTRTKKTATGDLYPIKMKMWGNDIVTRGKRVDQRFERFVTEREDYEGAETIDGVMIDKDNPAVPFSYLRKIWDMAYPIVTHTYQIFPDPVTNYKLVDADFSHTATVDGKQVKEHGEMHNHDPKLADKIEAQIDLIKTMNTANRLIPKSQLDKFTGDMVSNLLVMADAMKSNLGLPKDTKAFFTGNGLHIYVKHDKDKLDEWKDREHKFKTPLICGSNRQRGFVRTVGSTNMKSHMQLSFPLYGWENIEEAFSMANPCFFAINSGRIITRTYQRFDMSDRKTSSSKLGDIIENYRRTCTPTSSKNEEYLQYRLKNDNPELLKRIESGQETLFGDAVTKTYRWETIRRAQGQFTLDYNTIREMIR